MKNLLLLIFFSFLVSLSQAQVISSCNVPSLLASEYNSDIKQLATKRLFQVQSPDTVMVNIPASLYDSIAGGLAAIFNATSIPERDSVFNLYCVHNNNGWPGSYAGYLVRVDTGFAWTQAWQNMVTITGNSFMDSMLIRYHLHVTNFYNWVIGSYAELSTDSSWNTLALIDSLELTPGVLSAELNGIIGMAGIMDYFTIGGDRYYDFYFEFNDCFDGCDNYHKWSFRVYPNCSVDYLGFTDWGVFGISPLPAAINCNTFSGGAGNKPLNNIVIFPNPAHDKITIRQEDGIKIPFDFIIYDFAGRETLKVKNISYSPATINLGGLAGGSYIYKLFEKEKVFKTGKISKN